MLTLHHLENSRSIRILWLLEELGIEYKLEHFQREPENNMAKDNFKALHTLGKAPIISDNGQIIAESGTIIEYLLDTYGNEKFRPEVGTKERTRYNYWMHAAEGSVMNINTIVLLLNRFDERAPWIFKPIIKLVTSKARSSYVQPNMERLYAFMESELASSKWFAGDEFTAADVQMGYVMSALEARGGMNANHVGCKRWIEQMKARPAFQSAMEKNGDLILLKA